MWNAKAIAKKLCDLDNYPQVDYKEMEEALLEAYRDGQIAAYEEVSKRFKKLYMEKGESRNIELAIYLSEKEFWISKAQALKKP